MKTKIVSMTMPLIPDVHSAEELIVFCARVSSPENQANTETAPKLLRYLIDHEHWSPFEMADVTFEVETSRAIAAQILRHNSMRFSEFSLRYQKALLGMEPVECRGQDVKNRQNSIEGMPKEIEIWFESAVKDTQKHAVEVYEEALARGVAKESARFVLPLATTTRMYMKGSLRSWIHYFGVRCKKSTQKEHRLIALEIRAELAKHFPAIAEAVGWCQ